jgi:uncharacterized membrane protein YdbT with pleckstrin-like domain
VGTHNIEPVQEVDVWWGCYQSRALLPSFAACSLLTMLIFGAAWYFWAERSAGPLLARYSAYALAAAVWLVQLVRWSRRVLTFSYRLTNRRLLRERIFIHEACCEVELAKITEVRVEQNRLERFLGVGRICVRAEGTDTPELILEAVRHAHEIAARIRALPGPAP